ncbi:hypothetical protein [Rhodococcus erythropolis]|uniref:hypothetical protein n=1 Tax=Rhodococcus erythropolis TaxID=1833 RepID=UPI001BE8AFB5|nr:hypothetical protein [Rhodococcus erythropolis]MBT2264935.1 hypothetical protein [Rhodococcus erythropolis]
MKRRHLFSVVVLAVAVVLGSGISSHPLLGETEAAWTDSEYVTGPISTGTWTTSGYGRSTSGKGTATGGLITLGGNLGGSLVEHPTVQTQLAPGKNTGTVSLADNSGVLLGLPALSRTGSAVQCAAYLVGASASSPCGAAGSDADAETTSTLGLQLNLVSVLGITLIPADAITSTSVKTNARCASTSAATDQPTGTVKVGGATVAIPAVGANGSATSTSPTTATFVMANVPLVARVEARFSNIKVTSTRAASSSAPFVASSAVSVSFTVEAVSVALSVLGEGLVTVILGSTNISVNLSAAQCGLDSSPPVTPLSLAAGGQSARVAEPTQTTPETPTTSTAVPVTTTPPTGTTTPEATAATTTNASTTTAATATTLNTSPLLTTTPVTTTPVTTTPVTTTPVTSTPADPIGTAIHGPADSSISAFITDVGLSCEVPPDVDYAGEVAVECSDGTTGTVPGAELGPKPTVPGEYLLIPLTRDHVTEVVTLESATRG